MYIKISIALHIHLQMRKKETKLDYTRFYVHENLQDVVSLKKKKKHKREEKRQIIDYPSKKKIVAVYILYIYIYENSLPVHTYA